MALWLYLRHCFGNTKWAPCGCQWASLVQGPPICCRVVWVCGHTPAVKVHAYADYLPVNLTEASLLGDGTLQRKCLHQIGLIVSLWDFLNK